MDIPNISAEECVDRFTRGLKKHIRTQLCTKDYENLNQLMSDALKIEASLGFFNRSDVSNDYTGGSAIDGAVPMDISNIQSGRSHQKAKDIRDNGCFYCHEKNCRIATCPQKKEADKRKAQRVNNLEYTTQENDQPTQEK